MPLLQEPNKSGARASGTGEDEAAALQGQVKLANIFEHSPVLTMTPLFSPASLSLPGMEAPQPLIYSASSAREPGRVFECQQDREVRPT